ncbi:hypothetical protein Ahy_B06g082031 isoform B [Arachis hypogaea]|uniref:Uncharacterized protein n=1 Tax=Arachis hypogaea TaxID=3818 RepID=A0A444YMJ8_ARAHY|nr:hypothetical protein Ahy_B06g082031 isoform B [Arachis hypogaea]
MESEKVTGLKSLLVMLIICQRKWQWVDRGEVDAELEPSTDEEVFDDSADDGDHENHFGFDVEDNNPQSNAFGDSLAH